MAKKKRVTRKRRATGRRRSRSRVRGIGGGIQMEQLASVVAGAIASKAFNGVTKKIDFLAKKPIVLPIIKVAAGYFMLAKSDNPFVQGMGFGFIAEGGLQSLEVAAPDVFKKLTGGPVSGIGTTYIDLDDSVSGYNADSGVYGPMMGNDSMVAGAV